MPSVKVKSSVVVMLMGATMWGCGNGGGSDTSREADDPSSYTVVAEVRGLKGERLQLQNNGQETLTINANGRHAFQVEVSNNSSYAVIITRQPTSPLQICSMWGATGTSDEDVTVMIECVDAYTIGGTVSGLVGNGLQLQNNGVDILTVMQNGSFGFTAPIASGANYDVTIAQQPSYDHPHPSSQMYSCVVNQGAGTVATTNIQEISVECKNRLYFSAQSQHKGLNIWRTDGAEAGTQRVVRTSDEYNGIEPLRLTTMQNSLYFITNENYTFKVWRSDGTQENTYELYSNSVHESSFLPFEPVAFKNELYFPGGTSSQTSSIWKTAGTIAQTNPLFPQDAPTPTEPSHLAVAGNYLYFVSDSGAGIWRTDGTHEGTVQLNSAALRYACPLNAVFVSDKADMYAFLMSTSNYRPELWRINGQSGESERLAELFSFTSCTSSRMGLMYQGKLFFAASTSSSWDGLELWTSDGTAAGTRQFYDIEPEGSSDPGDFIVANGLLFFTADTEAYGRELWVTDGTSAGTRMVKNIGWEHTDSLLRNFTVVDNKLFFTSFTGEGRALWESDGTEEGTNRLLMNLPQDQNGVGTFNDSLLFRFESQALGNEPWRLRTGEKTPALLKDICEGNCSSNASFR